MKNKHDNIKFPVTYPNFSQDKKKYKYKMSADKNKTIVIIFIKYTSYQIVTPFKPFNRPNIQFHTIKEFR